MESAYEDMRRKGHNTVDNLIQWMKDSKILDNAAQSEEKAKKLFEDCADKTNVEFTKFNAILVQMAAEQKQELHDLTSKLEKEVPKLVAALEAGAKAFAEALRK